MKSKTIFAVLLGGAGTACCLAPIARAAEAESPVGSPQTTTSETRPSLQISSEVTPDFLSSAPSPSPRSQWIENPLLKPHKNAGAWRDNSGVQLLDAPQMQGFEIEILPPQPENSLQAQLSQGRAATAANTKFSIQTQQAAKIAVERAQLLERAGVPIMAGAQLRRAVALAPSDIASRRALAQWTAQHEQWPEAAAQWREVLYQLQIQSAAPEEMAERENWRTEATREMRTAQDHLMAFWQVPNVVTLGADSQNPVARSTAKATQPTAITVAATSTALSNASTQTAPLVMAMPQTTAEPVKSIVENVLAAPPKRVAQHEIRFDIVVTSSSYLHPQKAEKAKAAARETEIAAPREIAATNVALDSSREPARLLSMQRQLQPWLGDIVHFEVASQDNSD